MSLRDPWRAPPTRRNHIGVDVRGAVSTCVRPGFAAKVRVCDLIAPTPSRSKVLAKGRGAGVLEWTLALTPLTRDQGSKTNMFDNSILLGDSRMPWLRELPGELKAPRKKVGGFNMLTRPEYKQSRALYRKAVRMAGLSWSHSEQAPPRRGIARPCPTTSNPAQGSMSAVHESVKVYERHGRVLEPQAATPLEILAYAELCRRNFIRGVRDGSARRAPP